MSVLKAFETTMEYLQNLVQAERRVTLKRAFSGQLVSQVPEDEPASILLERIIATHVPFRSQTRAASQRRKKGPEV